MIKKGQFWREKNFVEKKMLTIFLTVLNLIDIADFISGLCFKFFYVFGLNWYICKKSRNKDFGGAIVQNQYVFKEYCELMF